MEKEDKTTSGEQAAELQHRLENLSRTEPPFADSYWVIPGKLLAGAYPGRHDPAETHRDIRKLVESGIRHIISLLEGYELEYYVRFFTLYENELFRIANRLHVEVSLSRIPIEDMGVPSIRTMRQILDEMDAAIALDRPVFVHCIGGRGRTGTVVGCYLVRHGLSGEKALETIKLLRKTVSSADEPSPETRAQREMVRHWKLWDRKNFRTVTE